MNTQPSTKICSLCKKDLPIDQFYILKRPPNKRKPTPEFSYYSRCKKCHYEINQPNVKRCLNKRYKEDPEFRQKAIMIKRHTTEERRLAHIEYTKAYYQRNREAILKRLAEQRQGKQKPESRNQRLERLEQFHQNYHEMLERLDTETRQKVAQAMQQPASTK